MQHHHSSLVSHDPSKNIIFDELVSLIESKKQHLFEVEFVLIM